MINQAAEPSAPSVSDLDGSRLTLLESFIYLLLLSTAITVSFFVVLPEFGFSLEGTVNQSRPIGSPLLILLWIGLAMGVVVFLKRYPAATLNLARVASAALVLLLGVTTVWNGVLPLAIGAVPTLILLMVTVGQRWSLAAGLIYTLSLYLIYHEFSQGLHLHDVDARVFFGLIQILWPISTLIKAEYPVERLKVEATKQVLLSAGVFGLLLWAIDPVWKNNAAVISVISLGVWFWMRKSETLELKHRVVLVGLPSLVYFFNVLTVNGLTFFMLPGYLLFAYLCLPRLHAIVLSVLYIGLGAVTLDLLDGLVVRGMISGTILSAMLTIWLNELEAGTSSSSLSRRNLSIAAMLSLAMVVAGQIPLILGILTFESAVDLTQALILDAILFILFFWAAFEVLNYFDRERSQRIAASRDLQLATEQAAQEREEQLRMLNLAVSVADISVYEVDLDAMDTRLLSGDHTSMQPGHSVPVANVLAMLPSQAERDALSAALEEDYSEVEYRIIYPGANEPRWSKVKTGSVYYEGGQRKKLLVRLDVTAEKESLESLRTAKERQREMFAVIGHELRTPVASIAMAVEDPELSDLEKLTLTGDLSRSLLSVLEDLRTVVAPERALETQGELASPAEIAKRATNALQQLAVTRGISLKLNVDAASEQAYHFAVQPLRQVITNLTKNAIVHSQGHSIWIDFSVETADDGKPIGRLRVEDDGKGIPPDERKNLFKAFSRGTTSADGSGLGLFIVSELSEMLQGTLEYAERQAGGSVFTFEFPLGQSDVKQDQPKAKVDDYDLSGKQILFVEDDATLRMLGEKLLTRVGAEISTAENGQDALALFEQRSFDLVITDIMMPVVDGYELAQELRKRGFSGPVVGLTAAVVGKETEALIAAGADMVLSKPISLKQIRERLGLLFPEG